MNLYTHLIEKSMQQGINKIMISAIITNKNEEILILERNDEDILGGTEELPKGLINTSKNLKDEIKNIIKTNTNLEIEQIKSYVNSFDYINKKGERMRELTFVVKVKKPNNIKLKEHKNYKWIKIDKIKKINEETLSNLIIYNFNKQNS